MADKEGMKPTAVQYPHPLTAAASELARVSARHGVTAYAVSLCLAAAALLGSAFYKEITHTFGRELLGVRMSSLWEAAFFATALVWLATMSLGMLCVPQRGRARTLGVSTLGVSLAAALLAACTLL